MVALGATIVGVVRRDGRFELRIDAHDSWVDRRCGRRSFDSGWWRDLAACVGEATGSGAPIDSGAAGMAGEQEVALAWTVTNITRNHVVACN